jgi:UDP-glucuronate decarboxylase
LIRNLTNPKLKFDQKVLPESDPKRRNPSIKLAKTILDWNPEINLEEGIIKTIDWFKVNLSTY